MKETVKEYSNGEVTVVWRPEACSHSTLCWKQLGGVFNPRIRPWIKLEGTSTDTVIAQVKRCPSGALQYYMNNTGPTVAAADTRIEVTAGGPYIVKSSCIIVHADGREEVKPNTVALCRCGASKNKPYCDGSHNVVTF